MRLSEQLRNEMMNRFLVGDNFIPTRQLLEQAADMLDVYYIQCKAASVAETRGEYRRNVKLALEEDSE